jgi:hypothetical protein
MIDRFLPSLSSTAKALLADARRNRVSNEELRRRVLERAQLALEQDRPSGISLSSALDSSVGIRAPRGRRTLTLFAAAIATTGLAAASADVYHHLRARPRTPPPSSAATVPLHRSIQPEARTPELPSSAAPAEPVDSSAPIEAPHAAVSGSGGHAPSIQGYALELRLLEPARRSIAHGDYAGALAAIARHEREYPRGQLAEEREALRVRALWGMGRRVAAESSAAAFRTRFPRSGLLSWMKETAD